MVSLTIDAYTNLTYATDYTYIEGKIYDNDTKQTLSFFRSTAIGTTSATSVRIGVFPGLSEKVYTVLVQLLDVNYRPVAGRSLIVLMNADRITRVYIRRFA